MKKSQKINKKYILKTKIYVYRIIGVSKVRKYQRGVVLLVNILLMIQDLSRYKKGTYCLRRLINQIT